MKVASALVSGSHPTPELAEEAVRAALARAELAYAGIVILFLTRDFARHAAPAVLAAARAAGCLQVFGCTASALMTEQGWLLDQSGAAAMVLENTAVVGHDAPLLSLTGHGTLPFAWQSGAPRSGLLESDAVVWSHGRLTEDACAQLALPRLKTRLALSTGLRHLGDPQKIEKTLGYDVQRLDGQLAVESLRRNLPAELRETPPLHQIVALRQIGEPGIPILSLNADGSLTLGEALDAGETLRWALRQPLAAEQDMRQSLKDAVSGPDGDSFKPDFALMCSCIGRGPLFYGNDDRDLLAFREQFPGVPLLGAYGSGQIAPVGGRNRLFQNAVTTLLIESPHV